jgi:hypothetical protein
MSDLESFTVQLQLTTYSPTTSFRIYIYEDIENGQTTITGAPHDTETYAVETTNPEIVYLRETGHSLYEA